jgi:AAHS family 4-hydroxybenzoate transporter-like MFS transporter
MARTVRAARGCLLAPTMVSKAMAPVQSATGMETPADLAGQSRDISVRSNALTLILCGVAMVAEGFDTYAVGYIGPALTKEWGISQAMVGTIYAVGVAASLFGSIALGGLSDRVGRKWLLIGSSLVFGVATLLSAAAPNLQVLILTRILAGLGLGASIPCGMALAAEAADVKHRATVPVLMSACIGGGVIVASLTAAAVMPVWGWRALLYAGGGFPLVVALCMAPLLAESTKLKAAIRSGRQTVSWRGLLEPRIALTTVVVTGGLFATYIVTFFFGFWLPTLLNSVVHDIRTVGLASALIKTCSLFGSLLLGRLMDRFGAARVLPIAFVLAAAALGFAVGRTPSFAGLVAGLALASFFLDGAFSGIIGFGAIVFPTRIRGAGIGLTVGIARLLGGTFGPMMGGVLLATGMSVKLISAVFALPLLVAALMVVLAGRICPLEAES